MAKRHERRKTIVVNREVQGRIILTVSWFPALCLAATAVFLAVFCTRLHDEALAAEIELTNVVPLFVTAAGFLLFATGFLIFNALKFSHRIAGPGYRIARTLEAVRDGDRSVRARLRKGDFLTEVADDVNTFLDWVESEVPAVDAEATPQGAARTDGDPAATVAGSTTTAQSGA